MTTSTPKQWLDLFLQDIAEKVQLSPTDYKIAQDRYRVMSEWVSDPKSSIAQYKPYIYPHGSFRTQSTTAANSDKDDFDVDCMLEMNINATADPEAVLQAVYNSIDRGEGTRYHGAVELKRRCVRVQYENMHLDLTPAVLVSARNPRESSIFDTHPARPNHAIANPEGFALWFDKKILPVEILKMNYAMDESIANAMPVPEQKPIEHKPVKLVALQLIKRFKDVCYTANPKEKPPSVLVSYLVAEAPLPAASLIDTMQATVKYVCDRLSGPLLSIPNPGSTADMLTDRWPGTIQRQQQFYQHMQKLYFALGKLQMDGDLTSKRDILRALFGEKVTNRSFEEVAKRYAQSTGQGTLRGISGGTAAIIPPSKQEINHGSSIKTHTNFGDDFGTDLQPRKKV